LLNSTNLKVYVSAGDNLENATNFLNKKPSNNSPITPDPNIAYSIESA